MQTVSSQNAPQAIGPYSQAIKTDNLVFCSGQIPLTPEGNIVKGDVKEQTHQVMKNLQAVLEAAASSLDKVVKTTIYLDDMDDFAAVNEVYGSYFKEHKPARATVEVEKLPKDAKVEIDCIATI